MSINIFEVPKIDNISSISNVGKRTIMIHDLTASEEASTKQIEIEQLLAFLSGSNGAITIRSIDNGESAPPTITAGTFTVAENEVVVFKNVTQRNDFDINDGVQLYMFKKGKGRYKTQGNTAIDHIVVGEDDFMLIYESGYGDKIKPGFINTSNWESAILSYEGADMPHKNNSFLSQYIQRLFSDSVSHLDRPSLSFTWGEVSGINESKPLFNPERHFFDRFGNPKTITFGHNPANYPRSYEGWENYDPYNQDFNLYTFPLGIKISHWNVFQKVISNGYSVSLIISRRRKKVKNKKSNYYKGDRWSFNKSAHLWGGRTVIPITQEFAYYDIHPEFLIQRRGRGSQVLDLPFANNKNDTKRANQKELLGFSFRFVKGSVKYETPIISSLRLKESMQTILREEVEMLAKVVTFSVHDTGV